MDKTAGNLGLSTSCRVGHWTSCSRHQGGHRDEGAELVHGGGGGQVTHQGGLALVDVGLKVDDDEILTICF